MLMSFLPLTLCAQDNAKKGQSNMNDKKVLVVFFCMPMRTITWTTLSVLNCIINIYINC